MAGGLAGGVASLLILVRVKGNVAPENRDAFLDILRRSKYEPVEETKGLAIYQYQRSAKRIRKGVKGPGRVSVEEMPNGSYVVTLPRFLVKRFRIEETRMEELEPIQVESIDALERPGPTVPAILFPEQILEGKAKLEDFEVRHLCDVDRRIRRFSAYFSGLIAVYIAVLWVVFFLHSPTPIPNGPQIAVMAILFLFAMLFATYPRLYPAWMKARPDRDALARLSFRIMMRTMVRTKRAFWGVGLAGVLLFIHGLALLRTDGDAGPLGILKKAAEPLGARIIQLLAAPWFHLSWAHVSENAITALLFVVYLLFFTSVREVCAVATLSYLAGALASLAFIPDPSKGFSGAVFGMMAFMFTWTLQNRRFVPPMIIPLVGWILLFNGVYTIITKHVDWAAHAGGLSSGVALYFIFWGAKRGIRPVRVLWTGLQWSGLLILAGPFVAVGWVFWKG